MSQPSSSVPTHPYPLMDATHSTHNSMEHVDSEESDWPPLPTNPTVAAWILNHEHSIKWTINQITIPIGEGDLFWFYFDYNGQEPRSTPLMLGKLSAIHYFIGNYAIVDIASILHYNWDEGWIEEAGDTFWINVWDLILNPQQRRAAQRAHLRDPTFMLSSSNDE